MFIPNNTTERFDANIFGGDGEKIIFNFKENTSLLYYYKAGVVVGKLFGILEVNYFKEFARNGFIPINFASEGKTYCGWVNENDLVAD